MMMAHDHDNQHDDDDDDDALLQRTYAGSGSRATILILPLPLTEKVLQRGEKIELLVDKTDQLKQQTFKFNKQARRLRDAMWWKKVQTYSIAALVISVSWCHLTSLTIVTWCCIQRLCRLCITRQTYSIAALVISVSQDTSRHRVMPLSRYGYTYLGAAYKSCASSTRPRQYAEAVTRGVNPP
jgi:hypothetical protein